MVTLKESEKFEKRDIYYFYYIKKGYNDGCIKEFKNLDLPTLLRPFINGS